MNFLNRLLSPIAAEFLFSVSGNKNTTTLNLKTVSTSTDIGSKDVTTAHTGYQEAAAVFLSCPTTLSTKNDEKNTTTTASPDSITPTIDVIDTIPLGAIIASSEPVKTLIDYAYNILKTKFLDKLLFIFFRRPPFFSNTPEWVFLSWIPNPELINQSDLLAAAHLRSSILSYIEGSDPVILTVTCTSLDELTDLEYLLLRNFVVTTAVKSNGSVNIDDTIRNNPILPFWLPIRILIGLIKSTEDISTLDTIISPSEYALAQKEFIKSFPISLGKACQEKLMSIGNLKDGDAIFFTIDDTNGIVLFKKFFTFQHPEELLNLPTMEPHYCLSQWNGILAFIFQPSSENLKGSSGFLLLPLLSLCQTTVKNLLESYMSIHIDKMVNLSYNPIETLTKTFLRSRLINESSNSIQVTEQILLRSEALKRPHPPLTQMCLDPFLIISSVMNEDGTYRYITRGSHENFQF